MRGLYPCRAISRTMRSRILPYDRCVRSHRGMARRDRCRPCRGAKTKQDDDAWNLLSSDPPGVPGGDIEGDKHLGVVAVLRVLGFTDRQEVARFRGVREGIVDVR